MRPTWTRGWGRVGGKAAALLVIGAGAALLGSSCSFEVPPLDPYYHGCSFDCIPSPRDASGKLVVPSNYIWLGKASEAPDCASVGLYEAGYQHLYSGLKDTARCPQCLCEPRPCTPPTTLNLYSLREPHWADCPRSLEHYVFLPMGWDGGCLAPREDFAERAERLIMIEGHEPVFQRPCRALPAPEDVEATWETLAVVCMHEATSTAHCDAEDDVCRPRNPEGFRGCTLVGRVGDDEVPPCPPELPERIELHDGLAGCAACHCDELAPRECESTVSTFADMECKQPIRTRPLLLDTGECEDIPGEAGTKSLSVEVVEKQSARCEPTGGERLPQYPLEGSAGARVYCCEPTPGG